MEETQIDPGDLSRLEDIVVPDPAPWWPLAAGWYVVIGLGLLGLAVFGFRAWRRWKADAYRRAALAELSSASEIGQIATILKRTALGAFPRREVAGLTGDAWCEWLEQQSGRPIPAEARSRLAHGVYAVEAVDSAAMVAARDYAATWIRDHGAKPPPEPKAVS